MKNFYRNFRLRLRLRLRKKLERKSFVEMIINAGNLY